MLLRTLTLIAVACPICLGQTDGERFLLNKITELETRLAALEKRLAIQPAPVQPASPPPTAVRPETVSEPPRWWQDTTASLYFDGYYAWNTNRPVGRVNLLRAYDVTANNLGINQIQAYGTYVLPVRRGVTIDFGKWASALGAEGNYTKDQINYSRSYFFNLLPFYHMGVRTTLPVNDRLSVSYWLVNGANQTEDINGFK